MSIQNVPVDSSVVLFTIAFNGYHWRFRKCIKSQAKYAARMGYTYIPIKQTPFDVRAHEAAWLKLGLLRRALDGGYKWVGFIDSDCEVKRRTPRIETMAENDKFLYLAPGMSGRINAGVIFIRGCVEARKFLDQTLEASEQPVPPADAAPYENGHVIHFAKDNVGLALLDKRWNNTDDPNLDDYIRHYCGGDGLRNTYCSSWEERCGQVLYRTHRAFRSRLGLTRFHPGPLSECLNALTAYYSERHAPFMADS